MLSVVIATHDSERALLPTLAALVAGAAAGVVREVIIADAGSRDATDAIADGAGCRVLMSTQPRGARLKAAADAARGPWLLFLAPGIVPSVTWVDETRRFIEEAELRGCAASCAAAFRRDSAPFQSPPARGVGPAAHRARRKTDGRPGTADREAHSMRRSAATVRSERPERDLLAGLAAVASCC